MIVSLLLPTEPVPSHPTTTITHSRLCPMSSALVRLPRSSALTFDIEEEVVEIPYVEASKTASVNTVATAFFDLLVTSLILLYKMNL